MLLLLLGFRKGRLLFLQGFFFSFINVSLDFACLDFTSVIWVVGFAAGPLAVVGFFGVVVVDPLFGFDVSSLLVAGGVVAWDSRGLHGVVGLCTDVVAAFSLFDVGSTSITTVRTDVSSPSIIAALPTISSPLGVVALPNVALPKWCVRVFTALLMLCCRDLLTPKFC